MNRRTVYMSAQRNVSLRAIELYVIDRSLDSTQHAIAEPVTMRPFGEGDTWPEPTVMLPEGAAQKLMDDLWHAGIRPTQSQHTSEVVAAKDLHIEHLHEIAAKLMDRRCNE